MPCCGATRASKREKEPSVSAATARSVTSVAGRWKDCPFLGVSVCIFCFLSWIVFFFLVVPTTRVHSALRCARRRTDVLHVLRNEGADSFHCPRNLASVRTSPTQHSLRRCVRQSQISGIVERPRKWYTCFGEKDERRERPMKRETATERTRREIIRLCHSALDSHTLRVELLKQVQRVISSDYTFFSTTDPATHLFTSSVIDETPMPVLSQFLENEFLQEDFNKFLALLNT